MSQIPRHGERRQQIKSEWDRKHRIVFQGRQICVPSVPRTGVCNWCRAVIGQINAQTGKICKTTQMHHEAYDPRNPVSFAVEICASCHATQTCKLIHESIMAEDRYCIMCGSNKTYQGKSNQIFRWYWDAALKGWKCDKCYKRKRRAEGLP